VFVSKSIERIQGSQRAKLEKHRLKARIAAFQRKEDQRQMVYQKRRESDTQLLRQAGPPPSAAAVEMGAPAAPGGPTADLFGDGPRITTVEKAGPAKAAVETAPGITTEADPFGGAAAPAGADPFGSTPPPSANPPVEEQPTPPPSNIPPSAPSTPPPATQRPATPPPASSDADPFAEPPK
jgi:hypothetical protein